jgi:hypothetical protein
MSRSVLQNFWTEPHLLPDGTSRTVPLPAHVEGHFGAGLCGYVLYQHHQNGITQPLIHEELLDAFFLITPESLHLAEVLRWSEREESGGSVGRATGRGDRQKRPDSGGFGCLSRAPEQQL